MIQFVSSADTTDISTHVSNCYKLKADETTYCYVCLTDRRAVQWKHNTDTNEVTNYQLSLITNNNLKSTICAQQFMSNLNTRSNNVTYYNNALIDTCLLYTSRCV